MIASTLTKSVNYYKNRGYEPKLCKLRETDLSQSLLNIPGIVCLGDFGKLDYDSLPEISCYYLIVACIDWDYVMYVGCTSNLKSRFATIDLEGNEIKHTIFQKIESDDVYLVPNYTYYYLEDWYTADFFYFPCNELITNGNASMIERALIRKYLPIFNTQHNPLASTRLRKIAKDLNDHEYEYFQTFLYVYSIRQPLYFFNSDIETYWMRIKEFYLYAKDLIGDEIEKAVKGIGNDWGIEELKHKKLIR